MREPSNRRKSTRTLQRSGHTKSKMIVLNAVHRFRVWSVHLSAPWRARQGGAGIQLCPPTIVVFNSFFNGCEIQNSHCMPWRYCLELFFSLYAFAWQSQESSFHSVSQSVDTGGKTRQERFTSTFPNAARNHRTLASQVTLFFYMEPPTRPSHGTPSTNNYAVIYS